MEKLYIFTSIYAPLGKRIYFSGKMKIDIEYFYKATDKNLLKKLIIEGYLVLPN